MIPHVRCSPGLGIVEELVVDLLFVGGDGCADAQLQSQQEIRGGPPSPLGSDYEYRARPR